MGKWFWPTIMSKEFDLSFCQHGGLKSVDLSPCVCGRVL